jgi:menaquinone-dependent protoporphyrinogen oxidase
MMNMDKKVLVTYSSKHGSTAEIAEKIGSVLKEAGIDVAVMSVKQAGAPSAYGAVVLGSAAYVGQWRKDAVKYLQDNAASLAQRPVWLFYSGPSGEGDPVKLLDGRIFPDKLKPTIDTIKPRDTVVFHGDVRPEKFGTMERFVIKRVKSPVGDFRDWDMITAWAMSIAGELKKEDG